MNSCKDCRYWGDDVIDNNYNVLISRCRRRSPTFANAEEYDSSVGPVSRYDWPWTCETDWCGEWEKI